MTTVIYSNDTVPSSGNVGYRLCVRARVTYFVEMLLKMLLKPGIYHEIINPNNNNFPILLNGIERGSQ